MVHKHTSASRVASEGHARVCTVPECPRNCELQGHTMCDYYSNFIEVENINKVTSQSVIKALKFMFSRYGTPDVLVTDNGPQFASAEFTMFAKMWGFHHITSSPHYPQSNGKAEYAVKTVKHLFMKCRESGQSEYLVEGM